jgi:predicted ATPase
MSYHLKEIVLDAAFNHYEVDPLLEGDKRITNLSKINIFVGQNNSGKSRFLRALAKSDKLKFIPALPTEAPFKFPHFQEIIDEFKKDITNFISRKGYSNIENIGTELRNLQSLSRFEEAKTNSDELLSFCDKLLAKKQLGTFEGLHSNPYVRNPNDDPSILAELQHQVLGFKTKVQHAFEHLHAPYVFEALYVPTLRGLRMLSGSEDLLLRRTQEDYFADAKRTVQIWTGHGLYDQVMKLLLGTYSDRKLVANFETFLSKHFFLGKRVTLIPSLDAKVLTVKIGEEKDLPIHMLGDGIQSIIILTFQLFVSGSRKLLVFVEEPELFVHPGMQRTLLEVFNRFDNFQYFLTTHSNHFLDLTLDLPSVSVYTFQKTFRESEQEEKDAHITIRNPSNETTHALELLGVRNSSVFLSNCTIWVEGITDRRYFSHFLKLFQDTLCSDQNRVGKIFVEDLHFSFVEYGGGNITHWSFLDSESDTIDVDRLCGRLLLITDKDKAEGAKRERHAKLNQNLRERYYCLKCKEVENLLSPETIRSVVAEYEAKEPEFNEIKQGDYRDEYLGTFIATRFLKKQTRKGSYAEQSGTITGKVEFCKRALNHLKTFDDLSDEAKRVASRMYDFIKQHN